MKTPEAKAVIAGKYRLGKPLDRGGMGALWVARHMELDVDVAIKFPQVDVLSSDDPQWRRRFKREAKAAARLQNRHVVAIKDYGIDKGLPYIVMELLRGEDLGERLHKRGRLSLEEARCLLAQLAAALSDAHSKNLIHRDLKPANIFLAKDGSGETAKIVDFGLARLSCETRLTAKGVVMGSLAYMSPEQLEGQADLDARSDVWSLAAVLFEVLTGRRVFMLPEDPGGAIQERQEAAIPAATGVVAGLPAEIDGFFDRALALDPSDRFPTVEAMNAAFEALATPWPVEWEEPTIPLTGLMKSGALSIPISVEGFGASTTAPLALLVRRSGAQSASSGLPGAAQREPVLGRLRAAVKRFGSAPRVAGVLAGVAAAVALVRWIFD